VGRRGGSGEALPRGAEEEGPWFSLKTLDMAPPRWPRGGGGGERDTREVFEGKKGGKKNVKAKRGVEIFGQKWRAVQGNAEEPALKASPRTLLQQCVTDEEGEKKFGEHVQKQKTER